MQNIDPDLLMEKATPTNKTCGLKHRFIKRLFDICFSLSMLIVLFPIFIVIALIIKATSKGKIIYFQERVGRAGIPFNCYKFRTMYEDAETKLNEMLSQNPEIYKEWQSSFKLKNDPRITNFGHFLRRSSLDELPQFWNVLIGDLSVVGPRPVTKQEIDYHYKQKGLKIFRIRPGITGIWQVSGRSDISYEGRIALDEKYVDHRTFLLDLKIIALTIPTAFSRKGAY